MDHRPEILQALGNETRLRVLLALAKGNQSPMTRYRIRQITGLDRLVVKRALREACGVGLVNESPDTREGSRCKFVYSLASHPAIPGLLQIFRDMRLL